VLNNKQLKTIRDLQHWEGYTEPIQFIEWATKSLDKPTRISYFKEHGVFPKKSELKCRKHIKDSYYQDIINYFAQGNPIP
jgi:hypothetical protein